MLDPLRGTSPRRVCLIKPSSLGDVVHALPVLASLKAAWPSARFSWVINKGLRSLVEGHPLLDEVIPFDRPAMRFSPAGIVRLGRFLADLHARKFDLAIDLQGLFRSGVMARATGAPVRVGLAEAREGATRFYTHAIPTTTDSGDVHAVDRLLLVAHALGGSTAPARFDPPIAEADHRWAAGVLEGVRGPRLVLNVGARWLTKRWPPSSFAAVARRAVEELGAGLVAVGAAEDRGLVDELLGAIAPLPCLDLCGATSLPRLAAVAAAADLFLSNDTGPLHLAAAAGGRVLGVYTCTEPARTGPYGPKASSVRSCVWCAPSFIKTCPRLECMAELTPEKVWQAAKRQLALARRHDAA